DGEPTLVARFASPLRPTSLDKPPAKGCRSLDYVLSQRVKVVRPFCIELVSGRRFEFKAKAFNSSDNARFDDHTGNGLPAILVRAGSKQEAPGGSGTSLGALIELALQ